MMKNIVSRENNSVEWYMERVEYLSQYMLPERLERLKEVLADRTRYMTVCMENGFHPHNASALIRHCDAFGVQNFHTVESHTPFRPNTDIVRGTDQWLTLQRHNSTEGVLSQLKSEGYRIVATTPHRADITPEQFDVTAGKFALIFGAESFGISDMVKEQADEFIKIPMWGFVESLNVSASAAILLYMLGERLRISDVEWQLEQEEYAYLLLEWVINSVRKAEDILKRGDFY